MLDEESLKIKEQQIKIIQETFIENLRQTALFKELSLRIDPPISSHLKYKI